VNAQELYDAFRSDVVDTAKPYLWKDEEVFRYMDAAYKMFVRLTGGIADITTSEVCNVDLVAGTDMYDLHPSILRIMGATRLSDAGIVEVINQTDTPKLFKSAYDYGQFRQFMMTNTPGPVRYLVIGRQRGKAKTIQIPAENDTLLLDVFRLPLNTITDENGLMDEVREDHHLYFLDWMKHLAYKKNDSETFDKGKSQEYKQSFEEYCANVKAEWERYKHKTRIVAYGGL
jgi:hypothetical protein